MRKKLKSYLYIKAYPPYSKFPLVAYAMFTPFMPLDTNILVDHFGYVAPCDSLVRVRLSTINVQLNLKLVIEKGFC